jgi:hypothetical protein
MLSPGASRRCELPACRESCLRQAEAAYVQNRFAEALRAYDGLVREGEAPEAHAHERWICAMKLGAFERAWRETDQTESLRRTQPGFNENAPPHERRVWNGASITNRRLHVHCYHGLGDTLQFIRYIPLLSEVAASVTVEVQPRLLPLLDSFQRFARIVPAGVRGGTDGDASAFDVELELMELPYVFRTWLDSVPAAVPYLQIPPDTCYLRWLELTRLGLRSEAFNVGLVWSSGEWNPQRNVSLRELASLGQIPRVKFFSLQRGMWESELFVEGWRITSTEHATGTAMDTAAAILNLDLIITVDTMVAHLAGALGKTVWTLLPYCCDWRWMAERNDTPWYPTMRLFRQQRPGDWREVITRVRQQLQAMVLSTPRTRLGQLRLPQANCSSHDFSVFP